MGADSTNPEAGLNELRRSARLIGSLLGDLIRCA